MIEFLEKKIPIRPPHAFTNYRLSTATPPALPAPVRLAARTMRAFSAVVVKSRLAANLLRNKYMLHLEVRHQNPLNNYTLQ